MSDPHDHSHDHSHVHGHEGHGHQHGPGCGHDHAHASEGAAAEAAPVARTLKGAWGKLISDAKSRLQDGINPYATPHDHSSCTAEHDHALADMAAKRVGTVDKVGIVAGATVSLGVALHGLNNIKRGVLGFKDKELDEQRGPSLQYLVVGAAETVGGLALCKRVLTGTWALFPGK